MTKNTFQNRQIERQKGAALIVGLIVLFIMTIIGMSGMGSITNQLKMSSNLQTHNAAF